MRTAELTGALLDYWVALANGTDAANLRIDGGNGRNLVDCVFLKSGVPFRPSTHWAHGGPIIERERMNFATIGTGPAGENGQPPIVAIGAEARHAMEGPTHLIAAMRAYVASKFGEEVPDV